MTTLVHYINVQLTIQAVEINTRFLIAFSTAITQAGASQVSLHSFTT